MEATPLGDPDGPVVMHQKWRSLLFLHWRVDAAAVQALLPEGLTVHTFDGCAWIGVVPFLMRDVRPRFLPSLPGLSHFGELNLRTYVLGPDGRPGVWFFSLDADQALAVKIARRFFHLPYFRARITTTGHIDGSLTFESLRQGVDPRSACRFRYRGTGPLAPAEAGSLDAFLVERYLLYAWNEDKRQLSVGRVDHEPYRLPSTRRCRWGTGRCSRWTTSKGSAGRRGRGTTRRAAPAWTCASTRCGPARRGADGLRQPWSAQPTRTEPDKADRACQPHHDNAQPDAWG